MVVRPSGCNGNVLVTLGWEFEDEVSEVILLNAILISFMQLGAAFEFRPKPS